MKKVISKVFSPGPIPVILFTVVAAFVFMLVLTSATLITFIMPETFRSTARIVMLIHDQSAAWIESAGSDADLVQTELKIIQSEVVLGDVVENLDLVGKLSKQFGDGVPISRKDTVRFLKDSLEVRPIRNTLLVEINALSRNPQDAAQIAMAVAESYRSYVDKRTADSAPDNLRMVRRVNIIESATVNHRPVAPNKPWNISLGALAGALLGLAAGSGIVILYHLVRKKRLRT